METLKDNTKQRNLPPLFVTGFEYMLVIKEVGVNVREFAAYIGKSQNFVRQSLGYKRYGCIPIRWVTALRDYVGPEVFEIALNRIRSMKKHDWYYDELHSLLRMEGGTA